MSEQRRGQLRVNEIFYSIQGESRQAGLPCVFVRLTYCNLRCRWCDSPYSFYEGQWMTVEKIMDEIAAHNCKLVEITGGEPLLQKEVLPFMTRLCDAGYDVLIETGGHMDIAPIDGRVRRIVDIKCPGSGEADKVRWQNIEQLGPDDELKFVIADEADYRWAVDMLNKYGLDKKCAVLFSPVFGEMDNLTLVQWILRDRLPVRFQLQMHKYIWAPETRGV
ncbi:MAG TPA: radical SAM protein [Caldithrix abyssi]|uniref:7-carboxy-7-deazaguanine synthase n=1 Tax=Caldithrix abyssi TaxID=187145 RepID=A0A7V1LMR8_CALAY|nr:radical SAM protein [Caldithrix abyssi]